MSKPEHTDGALAGSPAAKPVVEDAVTPAAQHDDGASADAANAAGDGGTDAGSGAERAADPAGPEAAAGADEVTASEDAAAAPGPKPAAQVRSGAAGQPPAEHAPEDGATAREASGGKAPAEDVPEGPEGGVPGRGVSGGKAPVKDVSGGGSSGKGAAAGAKGLTKEIPAVAQAGAEGAAGAAPVEDAPPAGARSGSEPGAGRASGKDAPGAARARSAKEAVGGSKPAGKGPAAPEDAKPADEGRLLAGRYRLGEVLGKGGMGTVWRAEDETLGRTVAVKELRFSTGVDEDEKRRLITRTLREAKAIARIRSGGAVTVYDVVDEDARPWIVMELIEGPSLAEFVRENGPLTPRRAAEVGLAVLDVLRAAHGQGILHRDVKPSNVLIAGNGRVVLTDFGIAQVEGDPSVTSTGMLVGAPSYISPERARGQKPGPPADMWSLGGLLYASVEGVPPYDKGSALATLTAVMTEPVDPPGNAGPLTDVIYGLLAKDPAQRLDDVRARAMLTAVIDAPEPPPAPAAAPTAEQTRQISLADAKEAAEKAAAEKAEKTAEKAAKKERERREREQRERARAALKSARKAAAVAAAAATAVEAPAKAPESKPKPSPVAAPLTDVMQRRTIVLAIVAVVVVLAAIGSLIAFLVGGDDKGGRTDEGKGAGKPTPAASGGQSPGGSPQGTPQGTAESPAQPPSGTGQQGGAGQQTPGADGGQGQGQTQGQGQGQGSDPGAGGGALPAGYALVSNPGFHFTMAMPEGFKQTATAGENSGGIYSRDGGFPRIQVDHTGSPGNNAKAAWLASVAGTAASSTNYRTIRVDTVDYRGYPTVADWEFEREQKGIKVRVLNRGFKLDDAHGYAIMISCAADQWDGAECTQMRTTAFETFQPLG
ncbi:serine/threonine-protein kinase [Streptomyces subrutilus]|uniref:serine/threonine-protein kinase n=1 Tax=Streptomyces subrutilus TaxID=36818 RepID=UPI002E0F88CE|nr:serine/threonine protein kinase [Streptomyces subrutilus]